MYLYVMNDVLFERLFFGHLGPQYSLCAYLKICVAIEGNGNCESKTVNLEN